MKKPALLLTALLTAVALSACSSSAAPDASNAPSGSAGTGSARPSASGPTSHATSVPKPSFSPPTKEDATAKATVNCTDNSVLTQLSTFSSSASSTRVVIAITALNKPCLIQGTPKVSVMKDGTALLTGDSAGSDFKGVKSEQVTARFNKPVSFELHLNGSAEPCQATTGLQVTLPGFAKATSLIIPLKACSDTKVTVSPIVAGQWGASSVGNVTVPSPSPTK